MQFKHHLLAGAVALGLAAGTLAVAQSNGNTPDGRPRHGQRLLRMATMALDLTSAQQDQAKTIFSQAEQANAPLAAEAKRVHEQMAEAIKANRTAEIDTLAASQGRLVGQMAALHAKAMAQFRQLLTPEQQAKADTLRDHFGARWQQRAGARQHAGPAQQ